MGLDCSVFRDTDDIAPIATGLNEIYRIYHEPEQVSKNTQTSLNGALIKKVTDSKPSFHTPLSVIASDYKKTQLLNNEVQRQIDNKLSGPVVFFSEYKGKRYPQEQELNLMLLTEHAFSDIPCLPITPNIVSSINNGQQSFENYYSFINKSIEWFNQSRKKPLMGIIPAFTVGNIDRLIKLYMAKGINAFAVDFDCCVPTARRLIIAQCYRSLGDKAETSFFYGINVNEGRFIHNKKAINAKDVLSFGFGIDAISRRHRPPPFPSKEQRIKLGSKWKPLDRKENKVRLFIKTDYGYYKVEKNTEIKNYPVDSKIPLETFTQNPDFVDDKVRRQQKVFNLEQLAIEASVLRAVIEKEIPSTYLSKKAYADEKDIEQMKRFKSQVKDQTNIDESL